MRTILIVIGTVVGLFAIIGYTILGALGYRFDGLGEAGVMGFVIAVALIATDPA